VHGIKHRSSSFYTGRLDHLYRDPHGRSLLRSALRDMNSTNLIRIVRDPQPGEISNLAAQSHVHRSA
jgi:GDPmannose 4,6-dehydratase